jgi:hypothetical protein
MNREKAPSQAMVTEDGLAIYIGNDRTIHPFYKTVSFEMRVKLPLMPLEASLYRSLEDGSEGVVRLHIRSALAQLGVDAFHPSSVTMRLENDCLIIDTLITSFNGDTGLKVIERMRSLIADGRNPKVMHAGFFPHASRVSAETDVHSAIHNGSLKIGTGDIYADGSIGLAPVSPLYRLRADAFVGDAIDRILTGEGRSILATLWEEPDLIPAKITSKEFLVTGVVLDTTHYHVVLRREVLTGGVHAEVVHGESCILQAGRTRGGSRQLELWNTNGKDQETALLRVVADLYQASVIVEPGH